MSNVKHTHFYLFIVTKQNWEELDWEKICGINLYGIASVKGGVPGGNIWDKNEKTKEEN